MSAELQQFADAVGRLDRAVAALAAEARPLGLGEVNERPWAELLRGKLGPQLSDAAFLVVAVVGGTNIGKSVVFNHLARAKASASSPLASGTKHPTCLVPPGFADRHDLAAIFDGFTLVRRDPDDPEAVLRADGRDLLFWDESEAVPPNLLLLDTPDVDSDAPVNWARAGKVTTAADVLLAVLTQQKYNDAAVKKFFRRAADADKAVVVVFNQILLPDDERYWPEWVGTFCEETGVRPEYVYLAPHDRRAAEDLTLPFHEREWPPSVPDAPKHPGRSTDPVPLADALSHLHFDEVKFRTLRGAIAEVVHPDHGVPSWLAAVRDRSAAFAGAADQLDREAAVKTDRWPAVPGPVLVAEIRRWWRGRRIGWSKGVSTFYDAMGRGVTLPFRFAREQLVGETTPPIEEYRAAEWRAMTDSVERLFDRLADLAERGDPLLRPRFEALLGGTSRKALLESLKAQHERCDIEAELAAVVRERMLQAVEKNPGRAKLLGDLDKAAVATRPAVTVLLAFGGGHAVELAAQGLVNIAADVVAGTAAGVGGGVVVDEAAGSGMAWLQNWLLGLTDRFAAVRGTWFVAALQDTLLGEVLGELTGAAGLPASDEFRAVEAAVRDLRGLLGRGVGTAGETTSV